MLYSNDDEYRQEVITLDEFKKNIVKKKVIICVIIILICFNIMILSVIFSINANKNTEVEETNIAIQNTITPKKDIYKHIQIAGHDIEKIKQKMVPQLPDNAQEKVTNIYYSDEKIAYLTFDDGPSRNVTPQILDILKEENVPATFFVLGSRVDLLPELVQREYNEGHYIANHGYSHEYSQIYASTDNVFGEYAQCENSIKNALGNPNYNSYLFRFPGGSSGGRYADLKNSAKSVLTTMRSDIYKLELFNRRCRRENHT